jgi:hypothetical protein
LHSRRGAVHSRVCARIVALYERAGQLIAAQMNGSCG